MTGISKSAMIGIISAQSSIELASQNQRIANATVTAGRIRERQGMTDENIKAIEEGREMQAKGKEMQGGTFEHLQDAISDLNNIAVENYEESEVSYESSRENPYVNLEEYTPGDFNVTIGDTVRGSVNMNVSVSGQSKVDIAV